MAVQPSMGKTWKKMSPGVTSVIGQLPEMADTITLQQLEFGFIEIKTQADANARQT